MLAYDCHWHQVSRNLPIGSRNRNSSDLGFPDIVQDCEALRALRSHWLEISRTCFACISKKIDTCRTAYFLRFVFDPSTDNRKCLIS